MKRTLIAAFAVTAAVSASAQMMMAPPDAKASKPGELMRFLEKDAYKKLDAPDAYILVKFVGDLPGNYQTAILRGLVRNAQEAYDSKMANQTAANAMPPMGDQPMDMKDMMMDSKPKPPRSYMDTLMELEATQDETDRGLIDELFERKLFTRDLLLSPWHERELDAITKYLDANAWSTQPVRLKYTSLAPHMYAGLPSDWANHPWPAGS